MSRSARRRATPARTATTAYDALAAQAIAKAAAGESAEAVALFRRGVTLERNERSLCNLGKALKAAGRLAEASLTYAEATGLRSTFETNLGLAECLHELGGLAEAHTACKLALAQGRGRASRIELAAALVLLGKICYERLDFGGAVEAFREAVAQDPANARAFGNLGLSLHELGFLQDAFNALHQAITLQPDYVVGYNNLAGVLIAMGQVGMALNCSAIALSLAPENAGVYLNYGLALRLQKDLGGAIAAFQTAVGFDPKRSDVMLELCHMRQQICDWDGLFGDQSTALRKVEDEGRRVPPFVVLTACSDRQQQLASARRWMAGLSTAGVGPAPVVQRPPRPSARRIRIGYLSADFHAHATAALIADVFERHDKARFETFGYSIGPDDGSALRARLVRSLDHFVDLKDVTSFETAAALIRADAIDVLLDLKGFTQNARSEILAYRPAPIQVNYLGYPGTMGTALVDYIIGDAIVTPIEHAADYAEHIVQLPHCYQPNDRRRAVAAAPPSREECGLPVDGFVFCSFNNTYKITPTVFDIWMRLLQATPRSVLWVLSSNDLVAANLRREAAARGVAEDRLVFAPFIESDRHIARMALADLFLDTVPVNAHTTASEALWVGLPVLTCRGETFAGRVASSLLDAIGLPELVSEDLAVYEATAFRLLEDPALLAGLRARLEANRLHAPLFDTVGYVRSFEAALAHMVARHDAAEVPDAFAIDARSGAARAIARPRA